MKYKIKIEIFDDILEFNLTRLDNSKEIKEFVNSIIMLAKQYNGIYSSTINSVLSEAMNQMMRHVIINKTYRQFYSDDILKVSVKAL